MDVTPIRWRRTHRRWLPPLSDLIDSFLAPGSQ